MVEGLTPTPIGLNGLALDINDYWMGRDLMYPLSLTPMIEANAKRTVDIANQLLNIARQHGVHIAENPATGSCCSSGWRPPSVNAATPGAAINSRHMTGEAIDLYDPDGDLDEWLVSEMGQAALIGLGLWMEHPAATKGWTHVQIVPPRSGRRIFYP